MPRIVLRRTNPRDPDSAVSYTYCEARGCEESFLSSDGVPEGWIDHAGTVAACPICGGRSDGKVISRPYREARGARGEQTEILADCTTCNSARKVAGLRSKLPAKTVLLCPAHEAAFGSDSEQVYRSTTSG